MGVITVTEEFLRDLVDRLSPPYHRDALHFALDGHEGAVGRVELARLAAEKARRERAIAAGAAPELVGDSPPGWRRSADGLSWEPVPEEKPAQPDGPPGWARNADTGAWEPVDPTGAAS